MITVLSFVMGLYLVWPPLVQAELDKPQLRALTSGLGILRDRLNHQRTLLDPDGENFYVSRRPHIFEYEYIALALESSMIGATAEDRARVDSLMQTLAQLEAAALSYGEVVDKINRAFRNQPIRGARLKTGGRATAGLTDSSHSGKADQWPKTLPSASGSLAPGLEGDVFPQWARGLTIGQKAELIRQRALLAAESFKLAYDEARRLWITLDPQYEAAANEVNQVRQYFLKLLSN